jgi:hypothetical protein
LFAYPLNGRTLLFPVRPVDEAKEYAARISVDILSRSRRFVIYGGIPGVQYWREWLAQRPQLRGWRSEAHDFGDIRVVVFQPSA